jgi:hypothetical protein
MNSLASLVAHQLSVASRAARPLSETIASALVAELGTETRESKRHVASRLASLLAPRLGHSEPRSVAALASALRDVIGSGGELPTHDEKLEKSSESPKS